METLRVLGLLMHKNYLIRKRQWKMSVFGEFLVPVGLIILIWAIRNLTAVPSVKIDTPKYYDSISRDSIINQQNFRVKTILYAPENYFTKKFMTELTTNCLPMSEYEKVTIKGFDTEEKLLLEYQINSTIFNELIAIIMDNNVGDNSNDFHYKFRTKFPANPFNDLFNIFNRDMYRYFMKFNILIYQTCMDETFIKIKSKSTELNQNFSIQRVPDPPHVKPDLADNIFRQLLAALAVVSLMIPLLIETAKASNEKFLGVNILMSMNGVSDRLNLFSWLLSGLIFMSVSCIIPSIIFLVFSFGHAVPFLYYGNIFIIWLVWTLHVAHLLSMGIHLSGYFSKRQFIMFGLLIMIVGSMSLQTYGLTEKSFPIVPYLGIIFPNLLLYRAIGEINYYETIAEGINWSNLFNVGNSAYKFGGSIGMIMILTILGTVLHFSLAVYLYAVNPGKYGVKKDLLYFLQCNKKNHEEDVEKYEIHKGDDKLFESVPNGVYTAGIQIRNLKKTYNIGLFNKTKINALKGISLDLFKGQITALLGHNGAGKTTMMSILTGMMSSSEGSVFVNSKNIKSNFRDIMNDMGLCTQENMVFPLLTVREQLIFFAKLKGKTNNKVAIEETVNVFLKKLNLYEKRNVLPEKLSGGQKRRVCLGMALVGDPSILILDEPTSGLDPESRRVIWDILLKMRGRKTILISTHDMEEADILGDRVAIMHTGQLRSYGTSMFLKKSMGENNLEITLSVEPCCDAEKIKNELGRNGKITNTDGSKIQLNIPDSDELPDALDKLERMKKDLGISGLSVSLISLEQVFLKVTQDDDGSEKSIGPFESLVYKLKGTNLLLQAINALIYKKIIYTWKNLSTIFIMILLVFFGLMSISLVLRETSVLSPEEKITPIRLDMYFEPKTFYSNNFKDYAEKYKELSHDMGGTSTPIEEKSLNEGLMKLIKTNFQYYNNHLIAAAGFDKTSNGTLSVNAFYSNNPFYSLPISVNMLSNTLAKTRLGNDVSISFSLQPLPSSTKLYQDNTMLNGFTTSVIFVFLFFPTLALFVIHPLRESSTGVKHLQKMTGVSYFSYWGTILLLDFIVFLVLVGLIIGGFIAMDLILDIRIFQQKEILILFMSLILFGVNTLPLVYSFSFLNIESSSAVRIITYIPLAFVSVELVMMIVNIYLDAYRAVQIIRPIQKGLFLLVPYVSFFHNQISFFITAQTNARCKRMPNEFYDESCRSSPRFDICCMLGCYDGKCERPVDYFSDFDKDVTLEESLVYLALTPLLYFAILAVLEYNVVGTLIKKYKKLEPVIDPTDEQVQAEKNAISQKIFALTRQNIDMAHKDIATNVSHLTIEEFSSNLSRTADQTFLVYELRKRYGNVQAVEDVSFGVRKRECFGLLGVNGAGKSTTFRMMTGGEIPDVGIMFLDDKDYVKNKTYFLSQMGYCPQNDALITSLNAYDHLRLFARLRGIPSYQVEKEVATWIKRLNLNACAKQPSGTYSGGNKRRLNIAIALIGLPSLVLLDEPTTGVDPGARRSLWNVIQSCQASGQAVVLTSHSMEECEALCNRLSIMVGGKLVCIGPSQELKQRFGAGYDVQVKINPGKSQLQIVEIKREITQALQCQLVDENSGYLMYHIASCDITWRRMYDIMYEIKNKYDCIEDFSVLSSTLEQLFLLFARAATQPTKR
ncbi:hypothetical protein TKK_0001504 [Trichogramma kaykai]|uniref:ABC transporter domain-containing protein n=1 Tax=Trichogramma kaykai TaxID=54128 RepID=A0ABD2X2M0_9HYME